MKCLECGKKMVLTALQSDTGHRGEYYPQLSIPIPANLHKATTELRKRLIEVFYGGNEYSYTESYYYDTPQHKQVVYTLRSSSERKRTLTSPLTKKTIKTTVKKNT